MVTPPGRGKLTKEKCIMGDMADYLTEQENDMYMDHVAGHPAFETDGCPYCDEEDRDENSKTFLGVV